MFANESKKHCHLDGVLASKIAMLGDLGVFSWALHPVAVKLGNECDPKLIVMLVVSALRTDPRVERGARALACSGYRVVIICPDLCDPSLSRYPLHWGDNITFDILDQIAGNYVYDAPWLFGEHMLAVAIKYRPLAFHCHDLSTALIGLAASRKVGAKCVCDFHEWYSENVSWNGEKGEWTAHPDDKRKLYQAAEALVMARADRVITVCDSIANELRAQHLDRQQKIHVIRNIPAFKASETAYVSLREKLNISQEKLIILWQGGTGPTRLLEPVIQSLTFSPNAVLVIRGPSLNLFGDGYRLVAQNAGVSDRLYLLPPVKSVDVVNAANGADLGLWTLPNLSKNFFYALPNKIFEYLVAGLPIVCANFPEARGLVDRYEVGAVFDPYDPNSIANAFEKFSDPFFREKCRKNVAKALVDLKIEQEWDKLVHLYDRLREGE